MIETPWYERPLCAFDTETTGPNPQTCRLVSACVARVDGAHVKVNNYLADPGIEIPEEASAIHGISTEHAREHGRPHHEVVRDVAADLQLAWQQGYIVVAFNASFDLTLIAKNSPGFKVSGLVLDPFTIDRELDTYRPGSRKLDAVCKHYGVKQTEAHRAEGDALAAARLAWKMLRVYPALRLVGADGVMEHQANWYAARQKSYLQYLARTKKPTDGVNTSWPIAS